MGGTCVNVGCVPKKLMWHAATNREWLHDLKEYGFDVQANLYQMDFRHSIERIGAPTASGLVPRRNVGAAYRRGVEVDASWRRLPRWTLSANLWLSANRIRTEALPTKVAGGGGQAVSFAVGQVPF